MPSANTAAWALLLSGCLSASISAGTAALAAGPILARACAASMATFGSGSLNQLGQGGRRGRGGGTDLTEDISGLPLAAIRI